MAKQANGFAFPPVKSPYTGEQVRPILMESANRKTGRSWQMWYLVDSQHPTEAIRSNSDRTVCGNCLLRQQPGAGRSCYVIEPAIAAVYKSWQRGNYQAPEPERVRRALRGEFFRNGAYGDPAMAPLALTKTLYNLAAKRAGYTHQWKEGFYDREFDKYLMRSCETQAQRLQCKAEGARTARIDIEQIGLQPGEVLCPAQDPRFKAKGVQCKDCGLCDGTLGLSQKDVMFVPHGRNQKKMLKLLEVVGDAEV